jgi:flagellar motor switch protein FliN/FliY
MRERRTATQLRLAKRVEATTDEPGPEVGVPGSQMPSRVGGIEVRAAVVLGHTVLLLRDLAALGAGSVVALDRPSGDPVDLVVNGRAFARGQIVLVGDHLGLRITELLERER